MAKVKFTSHFNLTSVDYPEVLKFIKSQYPDVIWHRPPKGMFKLIKKKGFLPTPIFRYCCDYLKKGMNSKIGKGYVHIIGIRKVESYSRAKRNTLEYYSRHKSHIEEVCQKVGKGKVLLHPILDWSTGMVLDFLEYHKIEMCTLYQKKKRLGCILCPFSTKAEAKSDIEDYPRFVRAYKLAIRHIIKNKNFYPEFKDENEVFDFFTERNTLKRNFIQKKKEEELINWLKKNVIPRALPSA